MGLTSFFKRKTPGDAPAGGARTTPTFDAVERVRTRTRQRLIGAVVLLTIGVIGFPLLFESQPRPIPVDIPIDIPRPDAAPALVLPVQRREAAPALPAPADATASRSADGTDGAAAPVSRASSSEAMPARTASASAAPAVGSALARSEVDVAPAKSAIAPTEPATTRAPPPATPATPDLTPFRTAVAATAANAQDPSPASAPEGASRFVVQVGAFADPAAARELRSKMEKLGLRTYTQVAETSAGKRIRVRLGPFATRAEADKVLARSREAGIAAVVLTL